MGTFPSFLSSSSLGEAGSAREPHEVTGRYIVVKALPQSQETHLSKLAYFLQLKGQWGRQQNRDPLTLWCILNTLSVHIDYQL